MKATKKKSRARYRIARNRPQMASFFPSSAQVHGPRAGELAVFLVESMYAPSQYVCLPHSLPGMSLRRAPAALGWRFRRPERDATLAAPDRVRTGPRQVRSAAPSMFLHVALLTATVLASGPLQLIRPTR